MSFKVEKVTDDDLIDIAKLSYNAFGVADVLNKTNNPIEDRRKMFSDLFSSNENILFKITRCIEEDDEPCQYLVAYSVIVPYKESAFEDHKSGNINLYRIRSHHILTPKEVKKLRTKFFCYFHSIYAVKAVRDIWLFKKALRELIIEHFCSITKGCKCEHFEILTEDYTTEGRNLIIDSGFEKLNCKSATKHDLWLFNSQNPYYRKIFDKKLDGLLEEIKRRRRL